MFSILGVETCGVDTAIGHREVWCFNDVTTVDRYKMNQRIPPFRGQNGRSNVRKYLFGISMGYQTLDTMKLSLGMGIIY